MVPINWICVNLFVMSGLLGESRADVCGPGWLAYKNEKCFKTIRQYTIQEEAASLCQNASFNQGTLASIDSVEEQSFLKSANILDEDVWIGARRSGLHSSPFLWADGLLLTFTNWAQGKPEATHDESDKHCVEMRSQDCNETNGQWHDVSCTKKNYALCQKRQPCQLNLRMDELEEKHNRDIAIILSELSKMNELLTEAQIKLEQRIESRFKGIEGAFVTSFEVLGNVNYYYPIAFRIASENFDFRMPLGYEIFRTYYEQAPESLNVNARHYMGLTLKLMVSDGGWDAGSNQCKVIFHDWVYNKGVGKVQIMLNQERRLFVWLRGGGVLYHIRSPLDVTGNITAYYEDNSVTAPAEGTFPAITVSPILIGNEDPDLVKPGLYSGWGI